MSNQIANLHTILSRLVSFQTVSGDHQAARECVTFVKEFCVGKQLYVEEYTYGGFPSIVISTQKSRTPKVILSAHLDVVPATAVQYVLHRDGEKLYGRGVYDMKFAVACYLQLLQALKDQLAELDFAIMLSSDEEIGGSHGVEPLLREGYTAEVCIIPDGGDNWCIEKSSKGGWVVELSAPGRSAHSSRPWEGDNAAEKLLKTLRPILALNTNDQDGVTVILTQLNGGKAINQVPSSASATVDVRFDNLDSYHEVRAAILKLAKQDGCRVKELLSIDSVHTNLEGVHAKSFREITADVLGKNAHAIGSCTSTGASDGRFFAAHNIPVIVCRPIGGGQHGNREWLDVVSFDHYYEVLRQFVIKNSATKS